MTKEFEETLQDIDRRCNQNGVRYAIIGGMATIIHGYMRTTGDIDVSILAEIDMLEQTLALFADDYIPTKSNPLAFFQRCLFVPLKHRVTRMRVDVIAALSGFERLVIKRSKRLSYANIKLNVCTVEDLILMKLVAARPKDVGDLQVLVPKNRKKLDVRYLRARAKEFIAVERGDVPEKLEALLKTPKPRRRK
jgi:predicted nucleotidyltransferase